MEYNSKDSYAKSLDYGPKDSNTKFCKHCGEIILKDAIICVRCGCQVENINNGQPNIVINNSNDNSNLNSNTNINSNSDYSYGTLKNKWVALFLCIFFGFFGAHKFYEGKGGMGIVYIFTAGLFMFGWIFDIITLISKPTYYRVY